MRNNNFNGNRNNYKNGNGSNNNYSYAPYNFIPLSKRVIKRYEDIKVSITNVIKTFNLSLYIFITSFD